MCSAAVSRPAVGLAAVGLAVWFFGSVDLCRGGRVGQTLLELFLDLDEVLWVFRVEIARMRPLKTCFEQPTDLPIGVPEMIVDGRVLGLELDRLFEVFDR